MISAMTEKDETQNSLFYSAVVSLKKEDECRRFFEELCSPQELETIVQRFEIASMLKSGSNYQEICGSTGASTATVCRVKKAMTAEDGAVRSALERAKRRHPGKSGK